MASTTALTGRLGKFVVGTTLIARATKWSVNPTLASTAEWGDSDGAGFTNRAPGRKDATFDAEGKYDTGNEVFNVFQPEDRSIVTLWLDDVSLYWDFPCAVCMDFNLEVDIDTEDVIGWTSNWGADGIYHFPGESGAASRTLPT